MADSKPSLHRDGTMQVTAKEGIALLEAAGKTTLLEEQGLKDPEPPKKSKLAKGTTMVGTAKEAARILGDDKPDADAMTRGQQKQIEKLSKESPPTPTKKTKLSKDTTMVATAKEAKDLLGKEKLGDTRQETKRKSTSASDKPPMKKTKTIAKTIEEAKWTVPDINVNEGRKTRSQDKPGMKRDGTMQKTAAEGKAFVKGEKKLKY